jgi:hypothetical protein
MIYIYIYIYTYSNVYISSKMTSGTLQAYAHPRFKTTALGYNEV